MPRKICLPPSDKMNQMNDKIHASMIALLGAPNAGKSTLLNLIAGGKKISAVTHKAQTTRRVAHGVVEHDCRQFILADTPGLFAPKISRALYQAAWGAAQEADGLLLVSDAAKFAPEIYPNVAARLKDWAKPAVIALNKIDIAPEKKVFEQAALWQKLLPDAPVVMISAKRGTGLERLKEFIAQICPNAHMINRDEMSDEVFAAEITREKILLNIHDELPWLAEVKTISFKKSKDDLHIKQVISVPHKRQKAIFIGKNAQKLKMIGTLARQEMKKIFETNVHLFLDVQVK